MLCVGHLSAGVEGQYSLRGGVEGRGEDDVG